MNRPRFNYNRQDGVKDPDPVVCSLANSERLEYIMTLLERLVEVAEKREPAKVDDGWIGRERVVRQTKCDF